MVYEKLILLLNLGEYERPVKFLIIFLIYVYFALSLRKLAQKTKTKEQEWAWIPILNLYLLSKIAKAPWWSFLVFFLSLFFSLVGLLVNIGISIWWGFSIAERLKKPSWLGIFMGIPILNLILLGYFAWSK
ncbi:MAG: hypothetical protein AABW58_00780 [Nanoarchaeota archaeon]